MWSSFEGDIFQFYTCHQNETLETKFGLKKKKNQSTDSGPVKKYSSSCNVYLNDGLHYQPSTFHYGHRRMLEETKTFSIGQLHSYVLLLLL